MCKVGWQKSCSFKILKMHALNGLVSVVVSANMAYLACTIKYLYYTCKTSKLSLMSRTYKCFHHGYKCLHMFSMVNQCHSGFAFVPPELKSLTSETWPTDVFCQLVMLRYPATMLVRGEAVFASGASSPIPL